MQENRRACRRGKGAAPETWRDFQSEDATCEKTVALVAAEDAPCRKTGSISVPEKAPRIAARSSSRLRSVVRNAPSRAFAIPNSQRRFPEIPRVERKELSIQRSKSNDLHGYSYFSCFFLERREDSTFQAPLRFCSELFRVTSAEKLAPIDNVTPWVA